MISDAQNLCIILWPPPLQRLHSGVQSFSEELCLGLITKFMVWWAVWHWGDLSPLCVCFRINARALGPLFLVGPEAFLKFSLPHYYLLIQFVQLCWHSTNITVSRTVAGGSVGVAYFSVSNKRPTQQLWTRAETAFKGFKGHPSNSKPPTHTPKKYYN
jgi:hypothetical protein